jgi:hypothetical protein
MDRSRADSCFLLGCERPQRLPPNDRSSSNPGVSWRHAETSAITDTEHWLLRPPGGKWGYRILAKPRPPFVIASAAAAPAVQLGWGRAPSDATALSLRVQAGYDAVDGGDADDCNGHGTHMAGIVGGETYGVEGHLAPSRAHSQLQRIRDGRGWRGGIQWTIDHQQGAQPAAMNMSLGALVISIRARTQPRSRVSCRTLSTTGWWSSPRREQRRRRVQRLARGRPDRPHCRRDRRFADQRASFSSFGPCVDLFAPGE